MTFRYDPQTAVITGRMFLDTDADNTELRASGGFEPGIAGQTVVLLNTSGHVIATTTTDSYGCYSFGHLNGGDYIVRFPTQVGDLSLVEKDIGSISVDSDADLTSGRTMTVHLAAGSTASELDAGYAKPDGDLIVDGASTAEAMPVGYADAQGDRITEGADSIRGNGGNDTIFAGGGNDVVDAGTGNDVVDAGAGNDTVFGNDGADVLHGGAGDDLILGDGGSADALANVVTLAPVAGATRTLFVWDLSQVTVVNARGNDWPFENSASGEDDVAGSTLSFNTGAAPRTVGLNDNDTRFDDGDSSQVLSAATTLDGNFSPAGDRLTPEYSYSLQSSSGQIINIYVVELDGNDVVGFVSDAPIDTSETYTFIARTDTHPDVAYSALATSYTDGTIAAPGPSTGSGNDLLVGDAGNDTILGGGGDDTVFGGAGDDLIEGGAGNDSLMGGSIPTAVGANLIVNGSFEDTSGLTRTAYGFVATNGAIPGWTDTSGNAIDVHNDERGGQVATDGENWLDLEASPGNNRIGQDVAGVVTGETYRLSFDVSDSQQVTATDGPAENTVNVYWGGVLVATIDPSNLNESDFQTITLELVGGAGDGSNRLEFQGLGQQDNLGASIDNVILVQTSGVLGGLDRDTILGGDGDDVIAGQGGNDSLSGGIGNDTLRGGAGDTIVGGAGDDSIVIDATELDSAGDNVAAITVDASTEGTDRDTLDLTGFVAYRSLVTTTDADGDSTSGRIELKNADGEWVHVTFTEIETLLLPPKAPDGVIDGEDSGELMGPGYDDSNAPTDGGGDIIDGPDGPDDVIAGNGGNDTINAGDGNDTVDGGSGNDVVNGGIGNDIVEGGAGDDLVTGGIGNDTVRGGDGHDELRGNDGNDLLDGGAGDDLMGGAEGNDTLLGGAGRDTLSGGSGNDLLDAGADSDTITGGSGNDRIDDLEGDNIIDAGVDGTPDRGVPFAGFADANPFDDRDTVMTGLGNDRITTGDDDDVITSTGGNNTIDAGLDDDLVMTGAGADLITSGEGSDTIVAGGGDDTIYGGLGPVLGGSANLIDANVNPANNDPILDNGDDLIDAGNGNDLVFGEDDNDTLFGGAGNDTLDGGIDDDVIEGGTGDDLIVGGQGADILSGGQGSDVFTVGTFTDPIHGDTYPEGAGDTIIGGEDADGSDNDVLDLTGNVDFDIFLEDSINPTGTAGESGRVVFYTDASKSVVQGELVFQEIEEILGPICFTPGTLIATPRGEVPVETLRSGDRVITRDNGIQEIRWVGRRTLDRSDLAQNPHFRPIMVKKGSLGHGLPERDMIVSPQHRLLIANEMTELYFNETEVLVPAKHLVNRWGISQLETLRTTYIHFMFDRHEVVLSNGSWTESFQPGQQSMTTLGEDVRGEIMALFPELQTMEGMTSYVSARRSLKAHEAKLLQS